MFAAQSAFICNECVMLFAEEVAEHCEDGWHPGKALAPAAEEKSERR